MDAEETAYTDSELFFQDYGSWQFVLYSWDGDKQPLSIESLYEAFKARMRSELEQSSKT